MLPIGDRATGRIGSHAQRYSLEHARHFHIGRTRIGARQTALVRLGRIRLIFVGKTAQYWLAAHGPVLAVEIIGRAFGPRSSRGTSPASFLKRPCFSRSCAKLGPARLPADAANPCEDHGTMTTACNRSDQVRECPRFDQRDEIALKSL